MKRYLALVLAVCIVFCMGLTSISVNALEEMNDAQKAACNYANSRVGNSYKNGYCQAFVSHCYDDVPGYKWASACCAHKAGDLWIKSTDKNIPAGAIVYFDNNISGICGTCGQTCGHVGIYVGDGQVVHASSGVIKKTSLDSLCKSNTYRGWGWNNNFALTDKVNSNIESNAKIAEGTYQIVSALNGEKSALDISGQSKNNKANVHLWTRHNGDSQKFRVERDGEYYKITNVNSGKVLDVDGGSNKNGTNVFQYDSHGGNNQQWIIEDAGDGYYYIKSRVGAYLDVSGGKSKDGTNIQVYKGNQTASQKFKLVRLDTPYYYLDVNGTLDGNYGTSLIGFGTVDVYINGSLVADDAQDFYTKLPEGTRYEIKDIKALSGYKYDGVASGALSGTISGETAVDLKFSTKHTHQYSGNRYDEGVNAHPHKIYQVCSCGDKNYTGEIAYDSNCPLCLPEAAVVRIAKNQYSEGETISLRWSPASRADYYEVKCYNASTGNLDYVNWYVEGTSHEFSLPVGNYNISVVSISNNMLQAGNGIYFKASEAVSVSVVEAKKSCTLYYDANGGIEPPSPQTVNSGDTIRISKVEPSKSGYSFVGWSYDRNGTDADIYGGGKITITSDKTLYAVWKSESSKTMVLTIGSTAANVFGKAMYNDVAPLIVDNRTMLPARFVAENLGAEVVWDAKAKCVIVESDEHYIELYVGSNTAKVDGKTVVLDSAPFIQNGRTYCPVRFICEALGATVEWDPISKEVIIKT